MRSTDPIVQAFDRRAASRPNAPLVAAGSEAATVASVDDLAAAIGRDLAALPLPPGAVLGLLAPNGPGLLAAWVALRRHGLVPILMDPGTPAAEQERIGRRLGAAGILRVAHPWPRRPDAWSVAPVALASGPRVEPGIGAIKITSGSTGEARGIAVTPEALAADESALSRTMEISPDDRLLAAIPMTHSYGLGNLLLPALISGNLLILPDPQGGPTAPLEAARRHGATVFPTVPVFIQALLSLPDPPPLPAALRRVISAGAPLPPPAAAAFRERFGRRVHAFYGASETGGICYDREGTAAERGSVGAPVDGVTVTLEESETGVGVVAIASDSVGARYLPDEDARLRGGKFLSDDLGRFDGNELVLLGRRSEWVNVDGRKVHPREVEAVLRALPEVEEAVVFGEAVPGRPGETLRAVLAAAPGRITYMQVLDWCRSRLSPHKVPRRIVIVPAIPRTGRGKIDRRALLELAAGPSAFSADA